MCDIIYHYIWYFYLCVCLSTVVCMFVYVCTFILIYVCVCICVCLCVNMCVVVRFCFSVCWCISCPNPVGGLYGNIQLTGVTRVSINQGLKCIKPISVASIENLANSPAFGIFGQLSCCKLRTYGTPRS